ncbi:hypothetical protein BCR41DRAFT_351248 [Lobosporangium transversale]|uniref:Uncharacterized protein n=1 Tax=Lobosporangium transversale TaxID=64571 RepID=A0A1Y2GRD5_9FUNG|nr:hypothetical protein BCR41DRAFT_351248 [Lobosporangium transversale]ORZ20094.1 hypothetical protein BCR41DRAFT_351248 [Lobosporangium transversale]|eukprot:XP_021882634.1 hypothetical protein BCR41DRAFT_351248 [Lobosporangium transversale]
MSGASPSSLEPQSHLDLPTGSTRPRTRSNNIDHTQPQSPQRLLHPIQTQPQQLQCEQQPNSSPELQVVSPSTAALDQILLDLSQQHHTHSNQGFSSTTSLGDTTHGTQSSSDSASSDSASSDSASSDARLYSMKQDALLAMARNSSSNTSTPSHTRIVFPSSARAEYFTIPNSPGTVHYSSSSIYGNGGTNSTGSQTSLAPSNGSLSTHIGSSPLQYRPHTPLKSSFSPSISSDHPSDTVMISPSASSNAHGETGASIAKSASENSFETNTGAQTPALFKSLSTKKTGRNPYMSNEKQLGPLPTINRQSGLGRRKSLFI